jgi:transposase-like protein
MKSTPPDTKHQWMRIEAKREVFPAFRCKNCGVEVVVENGKPYYLNMKQRGDSPADDCNEEIIKQIHLL